MNTATRLLINIGFLLLIPSARLSAATVAFHAEPGQALIGARIEESGELIGFVGDSVELDDGNHELVVFSSNAYRLSFTLTLSGSSADISDIDPRPENCSEVRELSWPPPRVESSDGAVRVVIDDPQFGKVLGKGSCYQPMMGGCTTQKVILSASSVPAGAEIWIDGEQQVSKTNTTLSVPYCQNQSSKTVLLRYPRAANCLKVVQGLSPDREIPVHCSFQLSTVPPRPPPIPNCSLAERVICELTHVCSCDDSQ